MKTRLRGLAPYWVEVRVEGRQLGIIEILWKQDPRGIGAFNGVWVSVPESGVRVRSKVLVSRHSGSDGLDGVGCTSR